ncbi:unnamed protein product [Pedinophyceae sp. YPF-701]|nr:unnamed protein product [Pedinophyceae sp. YPF-701]
MIAARRLTGTLPGCAERAFGSNVPAAAADPFSLDVLSLYRSIMRSARNFPSSNRAGLIESIRQDFRDGAKVTDREEVAKRRQSAVTGLRQLQAFSEAASARGGEGSVFLGGNANDSWWQ